MMEKTQRIRRKKRPRNRSKLNKRRHNKSKNKRKSQSRRRPNKKICEPTIVNRKNKFKTRSPPNQLTKTGSYRFDDIQA